MLPLIIEEGSYTTYNTENNIHFIEFKFSLANNKTVQKG